MKLYIENDMIMQELCNLYCDSKNCFWRLFFGWRGTKGNKMYFRMSKKAHDRILETAKKIDDYEIL